MFEREDLQRVEKKDNSDDQEIYNIDGEVPNYDDSYEIPKADVNLEGYKDLIS